MLMMFTLNLQARSNYTSSFCQLQKFIPSMYRCILQP